MTANLHPHFEPPVEPEIEDIELDAGHYFSEDFGTTRTEAHRLEPLEVRLRQELPDIAVTRGMGGLAEEIAIEREAHVDDPAHWNLLVTLRSGHRQAVRNVVAQIGVVQPSPYPDDVIVARVVDVFETLDALDAAFKEDIAARAGVGRVLPAQHTFLCGSLDELERVTRDLMAFWVDDLAEARFHVRCRHRGGDDDIDGSEEESFLGEAVLQELARLGVPGKIDFVDPDAVIDVETLGGQGAIALWTRDDLRAYPFLRLP